MESPVLPGNSDLSLAVETVEVVVDEEEVVLHKAQHRMYNNT